jgi:hypothetical protein
VIYFESVLNSPESSKLSLLKWRSAWILSELDKGLNKQNNIHLAEKHINENYPEPAFYSKLYGFERTPADFFDLIAENKMRSGEYDEAIAYFEKSFSRKVASTHFTKCYFDNDENRYLDSLQMRIESDSLLNDSFTVDYPLKNPVHRMLWGKPELDLSEIRNTINDSTAIIRFYQTQEKTVVAFIDSKKILFNHILIDQDSMNTEINRLNRMLENHAVSDSNLEKWYSILFEPFQSELENIENIVLVTDGPLSAAPIELFKQPDGDYLAESFNFIRHPYLGFISKSTANAQYAVEVIESESNRLEFINYMIEPFGLEKLENDHIVYISDGDYSEIPRGGGDNDILLQYNIDHTNDYNSNILSMILAKRDGFSGYISHLWQLPDQAAADYYSRFFKNLKAGETVKKSNGRAKEFLFGKYNGLPGYWGFNILTNLN